MAASKGFPPPGGGENGPRLPFYMDPEGNHGEVRILRLQGLMQKDNTRCPLPKHPVLIRKSVQAHLNAKIEGGFPEARGATYALKVRSADHYRRLQGLKELLNGFKCEVIPHPSLNSTRCVITCRDAVDESDEDIMSDLSDQGVKEIRRITRRDGTGRANTAAIIVTCHGTCAPEYFNVGYTRCRTRPYYPSPMQCFNCWAFGHTKVRCRVGKPICGNCSRDHPLDEKRTCTTTAFCSRCNTSDHALSQRSCPVYQRENEIQRIKVDRGISYPDARRLYEQCNGGNSYASVANAGTQSALAEMGQRLEELANTIREKDAVIAQLQAALQLNGIGNVAPAPAVINPAPVNPPSNAFQDMLKAQAAHFEGMMKQVMSVLVTTQQKVQQLETVIQGKNSEIPQPTAPETAPNTITQKPASTHSLVLPFPPKTSSAIVETTPQAATESEHKEAEEETIAIPSDFSASPDSDATVTPDNSPNKDPSQKPYTPMPQPSNKSPSTPSSSKRPIGLVDPPARPPQSAPALKVQRAIPSRSTPASLESNGSPIDKKKQH